MNSRERVVRTLDRTRPDHSAPPEVGFERYLHVLDLVRKYGTF